MLHGKLDIFLKEKAIFALDDFLWSRHQLFIQVLHHKTNAGLDAVLDRVINEACKCRAMAVPRTPDDFLMFTDDYVMSLLARNVVAGKLKASAIGRILVDRMIPGYLGSLKLNEAVPQSMMDGYQKDLADKHGLASDDIIHWRVSSTLWKKSAALAKIAKRDRADKYDLERSSLKGIQVNYSNVYFFELPNRSTPKNKPNRARRAKR